MNKCSFKKNTQSSLYIVRHLLLSSLSYIVYVYTMGTARILEFSHLLFRKRHCTSHIDTDGYGIGNLHEDKSGGCEVRAVCSFQHTATTYHSFQRRYGTFRSEKLQEQLTLLETNPLWTYSTQKFIFSTLKKIEILFVIC